MISIENKWFFLREDCYLDCHICCDVLLDKVSSELDIKDFEISSESDVDKLEIREEKKLSVTPADDVELFGRYPVPPRSTCKWASLRSLPSRDNA